MSKVKIIIIALVVLVIVGVAAFFIQRGAKKTPTNPNTGTGSQNGTGGLGNLPTGTTDQGRGFVVITDPTQPFVTIKPRGAENNADNNFKPGGKDNSQTGLSNQQQYDLGLVPDANGYYKQLVDASGTNQYMANQQADYSLSDQDFLNKYYPDNVAFNAGQTQAQLDQLALDSPVVDNPSVADIADTPSVDASMFKVSSDNSVAATKAYLQGLSAATKDLDIFYDTDLVNTLLTLNTTADVQAYLDKTALVANAIRAVPVPSQLINFSKAYLNSYQLLAAVLTDEKNIIKNPSSKNPAINSYSTDTTSFTDQLSAVYDNITLLKSLNQ